MPLLEIVIHYKKLNLRPFDLLCPSVACKNGIRDCSFPFQQVLLKKSSVPGMFNFHILAFSGIKPVQKTLSTRESRVFMSCGCSRGKQISLGKKYILLDVIWWIKEYQGLGGGFQCVLIMNLVQNYLSPSAPRGFPRVKCCLNEAWALPTGCLGLLEIYFAKKKPSTQSAWDTKSGFLYH